MPITEQDLMAGAAEFVKKYNALETLVNRQESQLKALISLVSETDQSKTAQVHGLCEDQSCEACANQGQKIIDDSYQQGQHDILDQLDEWLLLAGGEPFRQKIVEILAQGQKLYEHNQQGVSIVA